MKSVRVAAVSMNGFLGEPERVLNNIAGWCERAAAEKAELMLFPFQLHAMRARETFCFAVLADQAGRAGYVDLYPKDSPNQPHHAGAALIFGPDGESLGSTQSDRIREEMIGATLDAALLAKHRSLANYTLRTRRPELFGELVKDQVSC